MQEYLLLLKTSTKIWFTSTFKSKSKKKMIGTVFGYLALLGFAVAWTVMSFNLFKDLIGMFPEGSEFFLQSSVLAIAQTLSLGTILFLFLTGLRVIHEYLFESPDMYFLLATPLKVKNIFAAKFTECLGLIFLSVSIMTLTPLLGLGMAFKAGIGYYLTTIISFLAGFVLFGSTAALLLLLIMRYVPGQRLKQILLSGTLIMGLIIVFITQAMSSSMMNLTEEEIIGVLSGLTDLGINKLSFLPHVWMAKSSVAMLPGSQVNLLTNLLPLLISAAVIFALTTSLSAKLYLSGWSSGNETDAIKKKKQKTKLKSATQVSNGKTRGKPFLAMLKKEMLFLKREPMLWYQIAIGLIVMGFFAFNSMKGNTSSGTPSLTPDYIEQSLTLFMVLLFSGLSGPTVAGLAISREGKNWRFMQALPLEPKTIYWSKFIFGYLPCLLEGLIGLVVFHFIPNMNVFPFYITVPILSLALAALISIDLWTDVYYPNFNIQIGSTKTTEGTGKILLINLAMMPAIVLLGATFTFPWWYHQIALFKDLSQTVAKVIGFGIFGLETIGVFLLCVRTSIKRLGKLMTGAVDAKGA